VGEAGVYDNTAPALNFLCIMGFLASAAAIIIDFVPTRHSERSFGCASPDAPRQRGQP
jgi:hypothetical protein